MPTELVDLELSKVELLSVVDKGASGNARFRPRIVLLKRQKKEGGIMGILDRIRKNVNKTLDETIAAAGGTADGASLKRALDGLGLSDDAIERIAKADTPQAAFLEMLETMGLSAEQAAALKMAFMSAMAATPPPVATPTIEPVAKPTPPTDGDPPAADNPAPGDEEEMKKKLDAMPETVRKEFFAQKQRLDELEKEHAEYVTKRELAAEVEVAKRFPHVQGDIQQRAAMLLAVRKNSGDKAYERLVSVYEDAERLATKKGGDFDQLGNSREPPNDDDKAVFDAEIKDIQKADRCSREVAFKRAKEANPELYARVHLADR